MLMRLLAKREFTYLLVGGFNSIVGYSIVVGLYYILRSRLDILAIGAIGNILAISISFLTYKIFVFKTDGRWLLEYLRSYLVYGFAALMNILLLWLFVEKFSFNVWLAQGMSMLLTVVLSYIAHSRFTFSRR